MTPGAMILVTMKCRRVGMKNYELEASINLLKFMLVAS